MPKHTIKLYMLRNIQICVERETERELLSKLTDFSPILEACVLYIHCSQFSLYEQSIYQSEDESSENQI